MYVHRGGQVACLFSLYISKTKEVPSGCDVNHTIQDFEPDVGIRWDFGESQHGSEYILYIGVISHHQERMPWLTG